MRTLLNKIFSGRIGFGYFFISAFGFIIGLGVVMISIQAYLKIDSILNPKKNFSQYIILNKEVGMANTLFGSKVAFTKSDLEDLRKQNFVDDIGEFQSNQFQVQASVGSHMGFVTEMFFESIPPRFIDNVPSEFRWQEGSDFLPIIVSQDFLNLYNFGFALGRGTPQLSKSTIRLVPMQIEVTGRNGRLLLQGKVVGFSDRVPTVLVPEEFLTWANKKIGGVNQQDVSRVIIKTKGESTKGMEHYFAEHGFSVGQDKLKLSRVSTFVNIAMSVLLGFGVLFIVYSMVIVIMNFSLMLAEAKEEIRLLFQLGYKRKYIFNHLLIYLSLFMIIETVLSLILFFVLNTILLSWFTKEGIEVSTSIESPVILGAAFFIITSFMISIISVFRVLKKYS